MLDIVKVQMFRIKKSTLFWVLLGVTVALPLFGALATVSVSGIIGSHGGNVKEILHSLGLTSDFLQGSVQLSSWPAIFALITSAILLSTEFSDGTVRNVLLANKTRAQLYFAYLIVALMIAVTYFIAFFLVIIAVVAPIFGFDGMSAGQATSATLCSFGLGLIAVVFVETCMCMSLFAVRKQWAAILVPLLIALFVPVLIELFVTIIVAIKAIKDQVVSPLDSLRWVPFANITMYNPASLDAVVVGMNVLYLTVFAAAFVTLGYFTFEKADLK